MQPPDAALLRLLRPQSIALIGASSWTDAVAAGNRAIGYRGALWRIHPTRTSDALLPCYRSVAELPAAPDAAFVAVPSAEAVSIAAQLSVRGAGGFVCFASGFAETGTAAGDALTQALLARAGALPFFGPNCYGFVNFFDQAALWPDQVVGSRPERGVALICQSGTIALTLMFSERSLPIGYLLTVGNQARLAVEDLIEALCEEERVSAFGLYLEGIKDPARFAAAVARARAAGKPIAVIKSGRTESAARTARSHTGALAGADHVFDAFCRQAGIARCETLSTLIETLKIFHSGGVLSGPRVLIMGASGGDMAMTADLARDLALDFPSLPAATATQMQSILTDRVTLANPLDFHTYIWFDRNRMGALFRAAMAAGYDAVGFMLDNPPEARADTIAFMPAIEEFIAAARGAPTRAVLIASLPETLAPATRERALANAVVPLQGQREALEALSLSAGVGLIWRAGTAPQVHPLAPPGACVHSLSESAAKEALAAYGVSTPRSLAATRATLAEAAHRIGYPVVLKALSASIEHKSDVGGVVLNVRTPAEAETAAERLGTLAPALLVEEMIEDTVAEVLVGVVRDAQFGQMLVLGAGGVLAELLHDSTTLLPPFTPQAILESLQRLRLWPLLMGFRGRPAGDVPALIGLIGAVTQYAMATRDTLVELDVNPVIVRPAGAGAIAVDALIRHAQEQ